MSLCTVKYLDPSVKLLKKRLLAISIKEELCQPQPLMTEISIKSVKNTIAVQYVFNQPCINIQLQVLTESKNVFCGSGSVQIIS